MQTIDSLIREVLETHVQAPDEDTCCCAERWPCPQARIAQDWRRMRADGARRWYNQSAEEIGTVRHFLCGMCSGKETGLLCQECVKEATELDDE